ncbi:MAG: creatininase family protein [Candidatus Thorarchaeota archaeon]
MRSRKLGDLSFQEIRDYLSELAFPRVILPIGALEAHGPHLPLTTDTICATGLAIRISEMLDALVLPPVHYGVVNSLAAYPGSLTIRESVFREFLIDILEGLASDGFTEIVILNGHGGNRPALDSIAKEFPKRKPDIRLVLIHWWILGKEIGKKILKNGIGHAGSDETALVVAFAPNLVLYDKIPAEDQVTILKEGFRAYPLPGSILLYEEGDEFTKIPDEKLSNQLIDSLVTKTVALVEEAFQTLRKNLYKPK